jgi:hypothetical protein
VRVYDFRLRIFDCHKNRALSEMIVNGQSGSDSSLGMAREMTIDAFWQQTFAAALTTAREGGASAFGPHAGAKTVLLLARSFRWLISAFHKAEK